MRGSDINQNWTQLTKSHERLAHADDVVLCGGELKSIPRLIEVLDRFGLLVNRGKTNKSK